MGSDIFYISSTRSCDLWLQACSLWLYYRPEQAMEAPSRRGYGPRPAPAEQGAGTASCAPTTAPLLPLLCPSHWAEATSSGFYQLTRKCLIQTISLQRASHLKNCYVVIWMTVMGLILTLIPPFMYITYMHTTEHYIHVYRDIYIHVHNCIQHCICSPRAV